MDNQRLPIRSLIKEIKGNYYNQEKAKSRITPSYYRDTEAEASVANERILTQVEVSPQLKTSGNAVHPSHRRKQSANIPYKMSNIHTNIGRLWINDRNECSSEPINCQFNNNIEEDDDDEESNVGWEAEESAECPFSNKQIQAYPKKGMGCYDNNFRSSTTKSGSSSLGRYKPSEGHAQIAFSTEDDDENFMTLECDENLYDDDRMNDEEEEKVVIHPSRTKQSFIGLQNQTKVKDQKAKETVNDTVADFGFIKEEKASKKAEKKKISKVEKSKQPK